LVAPLTTIKGLGEKAIEQIINNRPFKTIEEFIFNENIVYSKLNKKAIGVLCKTGAMKDLIDDRFSGDKHFWSVVCVDKPRSRKKLAEKIELYKPEGSFTRQERIDLLTSLTGMFPFDLVLTDEVKETLRRTMFSLMEKNKAMDPTSFSSFSDYKKDQTVWCFGIIREITKRKTRNNKTFYVVEMIDTNSVQSRVRCWGVDGSTESLEINKPYFVNAAHSDSWGFSTRGFIENKWIKIE